MVVVVVKSGCGAMESRPLFSVRISPDWSSPGGIITNNIDLAVGHRHQHSTTSGFVMITSTNTAGGHPVSAA